ncbi:MAG: pirin family protein [Candidatus Thermoplasmatota archaeon]|nr:pirin family protein [Candidatus Thermoplasmatota archaeon]
MSENKTKLPVTIFKGKETMDGAGVRLRRIFGGSNSYQLTDPFLLMDHFGSNKIEEYISGFPWHPHRGIETVTYLLEGKVDHEDSEGNRGTIYPNDLQWMKAASGIFHEEMPKPLDQNNPEELLRTVGLPTSVVGMQLWVNIPANEKMGKPGYNGIKGSTTSRVESGTGATVKVIAGNYLKTGGSFPGGGKLDPTYLDVKMDPESTFTLETKEGYVTIIYMLSGSPSFKGGLVSRQLGQGDAMVFSREGDRVSLSNGEGESRMIVLAGRPLNEQISWYGPIVMNTQDQIQEAMRDLRSGHFVRDKEPLIH